MRNEDQSVTFLSFTRPARYYWQDAATVVGVPLPRATLEAVEVFPNPFNPTATIRYDLTRNAVVTLRVFDVAGRCVRRLVDGELVGPGRRRAVWDGRDDFGRAQPSGVYFCRILADGEERVVKTTLMK